LFCIQLNIGWGFKFRQGATDFALKIAQTSSWAHPACNLMCTGGKTAGRDSDHIFLAPRRIVGGGIPPLPHSTCVACVGATLHFLPFLPKERLCMKSIDCFQVRVLFVQTHAHARPSALSPSLTRLNSPLEATVLCVEHEDSSPCSQDPATGHI